MIQPEDRTFLELARDTFDYFVSKSIPVEDIVEDLRKEYIHKIPQKINLRSFLEEVSTKITRKIKIFTNIDFLTPEHIDDLISYTSDLSCLAAGYILASNRKNIRNLYDYLADVKRAYHEET